MASPPRPYGPLAPPHPLPAAHDAARPGGANVLAAARPVVRLEGSLDHVTYANEESGWSVVRLWVRGRREPVTAVGNLLGVQPGESLRLSGHWVQDRKWGEQFRVQTYESVKPASLVGIEKYLGSGLVRGVGPAMAARLVRHFGLSTLDVIDSAPERLREVEGIGPKRTRRIREAWAEQKDIREVMVFLQSHGVAAGYAVKVYKQYGAQAIAVVQANPYQLALDVYGIGFRTADRIAQSLGMPPTSPRRAEAGLLHVLGEFAEEGHVHAPRERLLEAAGDILALERPLLERALVDLAAAGHVVLEPASALRRPAPGDEGEAVYLKALHAAEAGVAGLLRALLGTPMAPLEVDADRALAWFEKKRGLRLAPEQREAIRAALGAKVLVITGGPGTGKTTLVNGILSILEKKGRRLLLAAPTGRAAKRLSEATGRPAETVHRLLEFSPATRSFQRNRQHPLDTDVLVLDEVSMVDTVLALNVLKALPARAQLLLVGDVDQLPSVGPGSVLADVIASGAVPVVRLQHVFRQAQASHIVTNAHRINQGQLPRRPPAHAGRAADFYFVERDSPEAILQTLKELLARRIPRRFGLHPVDDVQVLVPMNRGLLGATHLNAELQAHLNPGPASLTRGGRTFRVGDKVMQVRNNYDLGVFNGDIGRVERADAVEGELTVRFEGRPVTFAAGDLDDLQLAYATTVHKAQGSEYPCVVVPLHTQHYALLQRNLLYTAVTRGKKLVVLLGSPRALAIAVRAAGGLVRHTRLAARLAG